MPVLRAKDLGFSYGGKSVLREVSLRVEKGSFTAITGPNGSGKSTLLQVLAGLLPPQNGTVFLKGRAVGSYSARERAQVAALVPASVQLPFDFTVEETVFMGRAPKLGWWRGGSERDNAVIEAALARLGLRELRGRPVNSLSSGEQQKVFIAQALAQEPEVLFLDEPTSHLDITRQTGVFELLKTLAATGVAVIAVTHDIALAARHCREMVVLNEGSVYAQGRPEQIITEQLMCAVYGMRAQLRQGAGGFSLDILGTSSAR